MSAISQRSRKPQLPDLTSSNDLRLTELEKGLIQNVHSRRRYKQIIVEKEFKGGYGGTRVFLVLPVRSGGESDARVVTKIGPKSELHEEKKRYDEFVKGSLPFTAAQVWDYYELEDQAALNYVFAGDGVLGQTLSLEEYYRHHNIAELKVTLKGLLDKEMGPKWYAQNRPLSCLFYEEYGKYFPEHQDMEKVVEALFHNMSSASTNRIDIPGLTEAQHPLKMYPGLLNKTLIGRKSRIHGDLHPRNVLVDESGKGWLIDFAKVAERHNLFDFIKLETYIRLMILAPAQVDFSLSDYVQFELALNADTLGRKVMPPTNPHLAKAYIIFQAIREIARKYMGPEPDFENEYFPALFLYCLAMLKYYPSHGAVPTQLVFITACSLTTEIFNERLSMQPVPSKSQNLSIKENVTPVKSDSGAGERRNVNIGRDAIGVIIATGNQNNIKQHIGDYVQQMEELTKVFVNLFEMVSKISDDPTKIIAQTAVQGLETEAQKGNQAVETNVDKWFSFLAQIAPDIWGVIVDTFVNPIQGLSTVFQKIANRAKEEKRQKGA